MLTAVRDVQNNVLDITFIQVLATIIATAVLALITWILKKNKDFYDKIEKDHEQIKANIREIDKLRRGQNVILRTIKRVGYKNGGESNSVGDMSWRTEQMVNKLYQALVHSGVMDELDDEDEHGPQSRT